MDFLEMDHSRGLIGAEPAIDIVLATMSVELDHVKNKYRLVKLNKL